MMYINLFITFLILFSINVVQAQISLEDDIRLAQKGIAESQYRLGVRYLIGKGVTQDYELSFLWSAKAAFQGHVDAQFNLGSMYNNGHGVEKNMKESFYWFERAAYGGKSEAQYIVAKNYFQGKGVSKDLVMAYAWIYIAIDKDPQNSLYESDRVYLASLLSSEQITQAQEIALEIWNNMNQ